MKLISIFLVIFQIIELITCQNPVPISQKEIEISVRDPSKYPICVSDSDCENISEKERMVH